MQISSKIESIKTIRKLNLNHLPEEIFFKDQVSDIQNFLESTNQGLYIIRDLSKPKGLTYFNVTPDKVMDCVANYTSSFSIAVSSFNYSTYVLHGDIFISRDLETLYLYASDNLTNKPRDLLSNSKWNISTSYYDTRLKRIPNIDYIIDYIFKYNLFNVIVEFGVFPIKLGQNNEKVLIFELRTKY